MTDKKPKQHDPNCACCRDGMDSVLQSIKDKVRERGYTMVSTGHERADGSLVPMTYTIGLSEQNLPEVVVFGVGQQDGAIILRNAVELMRNGALRCSVPQPDILRDPVYAVPVAALYTDGVLNVANQFAGAPVEAIQIVLGDEKGRFPWDAECNELIRSIQPLLFVPPDTPAVAPVPRTAFGDDPKDAVVAANAVAIDQATLSDDSISTSVARRRPH